MDSINAVVATSAGSRAAAYVSRWIAAHPRKLDRRVNQNLVVELHGQRIYDYVGLGSEPRARRVPRAVGYLAAAGAGIRVYNRRTNRWEERRVIEACDGSFYLRMPLN